MLGDAAGLLVVLPLAKGRLEGAHRPATTENRWMPVLGQGFDHHRLEGPEAVEGGDETNKERGIGSVPALAGKPEAMAHRHSGTSHRPHLRHGRKPRGDHFLWSVPV